MGLTQEEKIKLAGKYEDLEPVKRCHILQKLNQWVVNPPATANLLEALDEFEICNGLYARTWLEVKYVELLEEIVQSRRAS
jgi:hypothetical protein